MHKNGDELGSLHIYMQFGALRHRARGLAVKHPPGNQEVGGSFSCKFEDRMY